MFLSSSETNNDITTFRILTTFHEIAHSVLQLQKSLRYNMYYYCNVLYCKWIPNIDVQTTWRWQSSVETCRSKQETVLLYMLHVHVLVL